MIWSKDKHNKERVENFNKKCFFSTSVHGMSRQGRKNLISFLILAENGVFGCLANKSVNPFSVLLLSTYFFTFYQQRLS